MIYLKPAKLDYFVKSYALLVSIPFVIGQVLKVLLQLINVVNPRPSINDGSNFTAENYSAYLDSMNPLMDFFYILPLILFIFAVVLTIIFQVKYPNTLSKNSKVFLSILSFVSAYITLSVLGLMFIV